MYFDNNACVPMTDRILDQYKIGAKLGNILSGGPNADKGFAKMNALTENLRTMFGRVGVIYTSGGSESNSTILNHYSGSHIVCSTVEHSSITLAAKKMNTTWVKPNATGHVSVDDILAAVGPNTALVVLQSVNSETGAIQAIPELLEKLDRRIAVHIDHVQGFMKYPYPIIGDSARRLSISISFHKIGGPVGFGALIINYRPGILISGTQNEGLRGGTINIAGIYATLKAMKDYNYQKTSELREYFDRAVASYFMVLTYPEFMNMLGNRITGKYVVLISHSKCLPHTIFMCIGQDNKIYCNKLIKEEVNKRGITIGIGSACNSEKKDKDTLGSMKSAPIPTVIQNGFLRISLSCYNTRSEISRLVQTLSAVTDEKMHNMPG